jgi:hypothetical protein
MASKKRRVGEVLKEKRDFNADWTKADVMEDFTLKGVEFPPMIKWPVVILICERDGEEHRFATFSQVIINQAEELQNDLPLTCRLEEENSPAGKYYTLV